MRVIVTRPAAQAAEWVARLGALGIDAQALPLIGIAPAPDAAAVTIAWATLAQHQLVVLVSPNAARHFFAARPAGTHWPEGVLAASTGPGTTEALRGFNVPAAQIVAPADDAAQFDSEALWAQLAPRSWRGASVLIVRGDGGRDWLAESLRGQGAQVHALAAYHRVAPLLTPAQQELLDAALASPQQHLWLFSSSEAIDHLAAMAPGAGWSQAHAIATHPRIAARAQQLGITRVAASRPDPDSVAACIQSLRP